MKANEIIQILKDNGFRIIKIGYVDNLEAYQIDEIVTGRTIVRYANSPMSSYTRGFTVYEKSSELSWFYYHENGYFKTTTDINEFLKTRKDIRLWKTN